MTDLPDGSYGSLGSLTAWPRKWLFQEIPTESRSTAPLSHPRRNLTANFSMFTPVRTGDF